MKRINKHEICTLIVRALLDDVKANTSLMKMCVKEANKNEKHKVNADEVEVEMAFGLWAFSCNTLWLDVNMKDEQLREELIAGSVTSYSNLTGLPTELIERWVDQMRVGRQLTEQTGSAGFFALPLMFHLGYGDYKTLKTQLIFSPAALLYIPYLNTVTGYWKKSFDLYVVE